MPTDSTTLAKIRRSIRTNVVETTTCKLSLHGEGIAALLRAAGLIPSDVRDDAVKVTFEVPGGGDWSCSIIDIDPSHPLTIEWTDTKSS